MRRNGVTMRRLYHVDPQLQLGRSGRQHQFSLHPGCPAGEVGGLQGGGEADVQEPPGGVDRLYPAQHPDAALVRTKPPADDACASTSWSSVSRSARADSAASTSGVAFTP